LCARGVWLVRSELTPGKRGRGAVTGAGFVVYFFPDGFGAEDECDEFAGGGFAAIGFGGVVGGAVDFGGGVVNGNGEADALQHSQVGEVIAEEGEVRFLDAGFVQDGFEGAIL